MDPFFTYVTPAYLDEWKAARRTSAQPFRLGTPSFALAMIGRVARSLRRLSASVERWAGEPADSAVCVHRLSAR